jgi:N-acetylglucosaminyl-diphospho-decaprenol L-rhamnosyltransferase
LTPDPELTEPQPDQDKKRTSVVIVSFNRAEKLRKSLENLGDAHQVLVVDNGSADDSSALEQEFPAVRFIRLPKDFGLTKALNIGVRAADGEYILLLHDDTIMTGAAVSELTDFLETRQDVGAVSPLLTNAAGDRTPQVRPLPAPGQPDPAYRPAEGTGEVAAECVSGAAVLFRTFFLRALRHIDERYGNYGSDIELCWQVKRSSRKLIVLTGVTAIHEPSPSPMKPGALAGDRVVGTAGFLSKHHGFMTGMLYRIKAGLAGLATFRFGVVAGAFSGSKIDGTS